MAFNGSGVFQRLYNWVNDAAASIKIRADRMDAEMDGFAQGLSTCITKDGQTTITANLPMSTYRHTGVGAATSRTDYARFDQVQDGKTNWVDAGGTADAITAAYSIPLTTLVDGQLCHVRAGAANATTTPTFSPNGITARTIVKEGGSALVAGDIAGDGHELVLRYDLSNTRWELLNPAQPTVTTEFSDSTFRIQDNSDATKEIAFEASGIATGTTRTVTIPDKSGTLAMTSDILTPETNRNYINGMRLSLDTDVDHDILVSAGQCANNGNTDYETLSSSLVKQIDATFAAGTGAGGMFTGTVATDTNYYFCIIKKDSDSTIDAGFDTSSSGANTPSGYTFIRAIGLVRTNGSANIQGVTEYRSDGNVYTSAEQTVTYNSLLTVAHGLGSKSRLVQVVRICKTTEDGWAVGDEVIMQTTDLSGSYYGATIGYDATNVYISTGADITGHNKSTGAGVLTTASNWRYIVRAWS